MAGAAMCAIEEATISDLPLEVLSRIFTYLPYNTRVVRLVCSKWNEACNDPEVSGDEMIFISGRKEANAFFGSRRLLRNIYNLRLKSVTFKTEQNHLFFFENFGDKLRSLELNRCDAHDYHGLVSFLCFCKNLKTFILRKCRHTIAQSFRDFVATNIVSLEIGINERWPDESIYDCFRVCPHVRSFSLRELPDFDRALRPREQLPYFSFNCVYQALLTREVNLTELNLSPYGADGISSEQIDQIASLPSLKLRKLKLPRNILTQRNMYNIVTLHSDLEDLCIAIFWEGISSNELAEWINKCSKLTRLEIELCGCFRLNDEDRDESLSNSLDLLASRLCLRELVLRAAISTRINCDFKNTRTFDYLRSLTFENLKIDLVSVLGKVSINLNHLDLLHSGAISSENLKFISNRFTHLVTLKFEISSDPAEKAIPEDQSSEPTSFGLLEKLKNVEVKVILSSPSSTDVLLWLFKRLRSPNLQYIWISNRFNDINAVLLSLIAENYPLLERFEMTSGWLAVDPPDLRSIMSHMKRLSVFYIGRAGNRNPEPELLRLHQRRGTDKFDIPSHKLQYTI